MKQLNLTETITALLVRKKPKAASVAHGAPGWLPRSCCHLVDISDSAAGEAASAIVREHGLSSPASQSHFDNASAELTYYRGGRRVCAAYYGLVVFINPRQYCF